MVKKPPVRVPVSYNLNYLTVLLMCWIGGWIEQTAPVKIAKEERLDAGDISLSKAWSSSVSDILGITADQTKSQNPIERKKNKAKQTNKKHPMQGTGGNYSALLGTCTAPSFLKWVGISASVMVTQV